MRTLVVVLVLVLCVTHAVSAQSRPSRVFVAVNSGRQLTAHDFADSATRRENAEEGRFDMTYVVKGGPTLDVSGGVGLWRWIGVGVGITRFSVSTPGSLKATIPHPFFFNRARSVSGEAADLTREERTVHLQARGVFPVGQRFQVMLFGGRSFFRVKQTMITDYTFTESYPYDEATFRAVTTSRASVSTTGFNAGGDLAFFLTRQLGVGATVQLSGTSVEVPGALGVPKQIEVGGSQAGVGLRLRF